MLLDRNNSYDDGYGGIRVSKISDVSILYKHKALDKTISEQLFTSESTSIPDFVCEKTALKARKSTIFDIIFYLVMGIPFAAITLFMLAAMIPSLLNSSPSSDVLIPLLMIIAFACGAIFFIKGALTSISLCTSLKKNNYESKVFEVQEKYSYDNDGYDYYVVLNGIWVKVELKIYKNISIDDKIVCLLVRSGKNTYFIASDSVV